ncbi:MAG TPA: DUF5615 family PIN-like protein [Leptospiraceae bacterium]|nr:DUF5615 family PIN-like protein [Leptospiraceae bacterium]HNO71878.1 DUF5615 family PIN-like protein [Bacteroidia bacterium]HNF12429.1 DUF5615 family PIN-like protein [Leptospiraceae bacterium]HNI94968.1 DUF5615 family PIN-like protein [Leptospiraceae bacterium]HNM04409.1 DUF5615 family PIN-like protein [Leptospiraceae bacterium]
MLLFDANLSPSLPVLLKDIFPDSQHVFSFFLEESDDLIWEFAKEKNLVVVTKDEDFADLNERLGFPPKVILLKRGNCSTKTVEAILRSNLDNIQKLFTDPDIGLLILK